MDECPLCGSHVSGDECDCGSVDTTKYLIALMPHDAIARGVFFKGNIVYCMLSKWSLERVVKDYPWLVNERVPVLLPQSYAIAVFLDGRWPLLCAPENIVLSDLEQPGWDILSEA